MVGDRGTDGMASVFGATWHYELVLDAVLFLAAKEVSSLFRWGIVLVFSSLSHGGKL